MLHDNNNFAIDITSGSNQHSSNNNNDKNDNFFDVIKQPLQDQQQDEQQQKEESSFEPLTEKTKPQWFRSIEVENSSSRLLLKLTSESDLPGMMGGACRPWVRLFIGTLLCAASGGFFAFVQMTETNDQSVLSIVGMFVLIFGVSFGSVLMIFSFVDTEKFLEVDKKSKKVSSWSENVLCCRYKSEDFKDIPLENVSSLVLEGYNDKEAVLGLPQTGEEAAERRKEKLKKRQAGGKQRNYSAEEAFEQKLAERRGKHSGKPSLSSSSESSSTSTSTTEYGEGKAVKPKPYISLKIRNPEYEEEKEKLEKEAKEAKLKMKNEMNSNSETKKLTRTQKEEDEEDGKPDPVVSKITKCRHYVVYLETDLPLDFGVERLKVWRNLFRELGARTFKNSEWTHEIRPRDCQDEGEDQDQSLVTANSAALAASGGGANNNNNKKKQFYQTSTHIRDETATKLLSIIFFLYMIVVCGAAGLFIGLNNSGWIYTPYNVTYDNYSQPSVTFPNGSFNHYQKYNATELQQAWNNGNGGGASSIFIGVVYGFGILFCGLTIHLAGRDARKIKVTLDPARQKLTYKKRGGLFNFDRAPRVLVEFDFSDVKSLRIEKISDSNWLKASRLVLVLNNNKTVANGEGQSDNELALSQSFFHDRALPFARGYQKWFAENGLNVQIENPPMFWKEEKDEFGNTIQEGELSEVSNNNNNNKYYGSLASEEEGNDNNNNNAAAAAARTAADTSSSSSPTVTIGNEKSVSGTYLTI